MMRRKLLMVAVAGTALMLPAQSVAAQTGSPCTKTGFAFVASSAILGSIPAWLQADSLIEKDVAAYKVELAKLSGAFDSASQAYAQNSTMLSTPAKAAQVKKLQLWQDSIRARAAELDGKVTLRQQELHQPIQLRVQAVLDGMRAE